MKLVGPISEKKPGPERVFRYSVNGKEFTVRWERGDTAIIEADLGMLIHRFNEPGKVETGRFVPLFRVDEILLAPEDSLLSDQAGDA